VANRCEAGVRCAFASGTGIHLQLSRARRRRQRTDVGDRENLGLSWRCTSWACGVWARYLATTASKSGRPLRPCSASKPPRLAASRIFCTSELSSGDYGQCRIWRANAVLRLRDRFHARRCGCGLRERAAEPHRQAREKSLAGKSSMCHASKE
jgi:hypothetical protein